MGGFGGGGGGKKVTNNLNAIILLGNDILELICF